jgi:lipoyl(octanoyl) transferase
MRYAEALDLQMRLVAARTLGEVGDTVLLVEHELVVTMGRSAKQGNVLVAPAQLQARGVDYQETGRGGDVTLHGPGQLVAYPIFDLKPNRCDVRKYVRDLAAVMAKLIAPYGVYAEVVDEYIGLWVNPGDYSKFSQAFPMAKIGAIGVRLSRWITMHGFALNVTSHPGEYDFIVPCGIAGHAVTSLQALIGKAVPTVEQFAHAAPAAFAAVFAAEAALASADETSRFIAMLQRYEPAAS